MPGRRERAQDAEPGAHAEPGRDVDRQARAGPGFDDHPLDIGAA